MDTLKAIYRNKELFAALCQIASGCVLSASGAMLACLCLQVSMAYRTPMFFSGLFAVIAGVMLIIIGVAKYDRWHLG